MTKKLDEYTKEELIETIKSLKKRKKFGLVWEDKPEKVANQCQEMLPVLEEVPSRVIKKNVNGLTNLIIEGDNYHSLSTLNYTHSGKIDLIYIDPPYNTGHKDFIYNDRYLDEEDTYRHSKWLSFMSKRLVLAKELLADDGHIFISIDDNEQANLRLLCNAIFGEENFVNQLVWHYGKMSNEKNKFANNHEYIIIYSKSPNAGLSSNVKKEDSEYRNRFINFVRPDNTIRYIDLKHKNDNLVDLRVKKVKKSLNKDQLSDEDVLFDFNTEFKKHSDTIYVSNIKGNSGERVDFGLGQKPLALMDILLKSCISEKKDAIVLDFFAGSGTTGHAVMNLNKEDNGCRKFILCTNDENGIAKNVTYERIKKAIEQNKSKDNTPLNIRYFMTDFVNKQKTDDQTRLSLVERCTDMIRIREDAYEPIIDEEDLKLFSGINHNAAILFDPHNIEECIRKIEAVDVEKPLNIYIFSYSNYAYEEDVPETKLQYTIKPIPESILEVYKRIFKERIDV